MTDAVRTDEALRRLATHLYNAACHVSQASMHVSNARGPNRSPAFANHIEGAMFLAAEDMEQAMNVVRTLMGGATEVEHGL